MFVVCAHKEVVSKVNQTALIDATLVNAAQARETLFWAAETVS